jgi:glyoxylase-like metal-dependent hydrolase (beta-lactamase superfamily II)
LSFSIILKKENIWRKTMIILQIEVGAMDNFSYVVGCEKTRKALVIDPAFEVERIVRKAEQSNLEIELIVSTHGHGDHTAGNAELKEITGAKIMIHTLDAGNSIQPDIRLAGDTTFKVGDITFEVIHTPGHTPGGICLYAEGNLFTGDTLFVGDSGRTDLFGGHRPTLGASIRRLMQFPDDTVVWPGHNYGPTPASTIHWEKRNNVNAKEYRFYVKDR